ncbi:MAG: helix-turn-helix transcriptional regulator [Pseudomonadota bacterium]
MKIDQLTPIAAMLDELGERLALARKRQNLSQPELADLAGIGVATLRRIETGRGGQLETWLKLLKALGMTSQIESLLAQTLTSPMMEIGRNHRSGRGEQMARPLWGDERS